jgi:hypothetical protein
VDSVHGPWTTSGLDPRWTAAVRCARRSVAHRRHSSLVVVVRGGGGRGVHGGVGGALTRDGAAVKRPGDGGKAVVIEGARLGRASARERRKGGQCRVRRGEVWPGDLL